MKSDVTVFIALSKTLQRYENKSKSQPASQQFSMPICCLRLCKDTKIKANHNSENWVVNRLLVV